MKSSIYEGELQTHFKLALNSEIKSPFGLSFRPVFEETIEDHLRFSKRQIAAPISLSVSQVNSNDLLKI